MKDFNDIESYRNMRKRKARRKHILTFLLIVLLLAGLFAAFTYFFNIDWFDSGQNGQALPAESGEANSEGYPVSLAGETVVDLKSMGGYVVMLSETQTIIYSDSGKRIGSDIHGYANPVIKTNSKRALIYDRGGNKFKVLSKNTLIGDKTVSANIVFAVISDSGYVAVATQEDRYLGCLTVYNNELEEIYKWYSSEYQLVDACFYSNSNGCAVLCYGAESGKMNSAVISLDFSKEDIVFEAVIPNTLGISVDVKRTGDIMAVCDSKTASITSSGEITKIYEYKKSLTYYSNDPDNNTVIVLSDLNSRANNEIIVLDTKAEEAADNVLEKRIKTILCDGSRVILIGHEEMYNYDMSLTLIGDTGIETDSQKAALIGSYIYISGNKNIEKLLVE